MSHNRHSYVPFYPSDWLGGTARMTRLHKSVYFDVCCYNWDTARACPAGELPLMLGDLPNWRDLVEDLIAAGKLNRDDDGGLWNPRAMGEAEKAFDLWKRKSTGGKRGAAKTNTGDGSGDGTPDGSVSGSSPKTGKTPDAEPEPEPEPDEIEDKPLSLSAPRKARSAATRLPANWKPKALCLSTKAGQIADRRGPDWLDTTLETFTNHWRAKSGKDATKTDWQATWANWVINQDRIDGRSRGNGNGTDQHASRSGYGRTVDAALEFVEEIERERQGGHTR